jgi:uncharacterized protein YodC (DUF2158 family)
MANVFNPGDRVRLKSGGPEMTVGEFGAFASIEGYACEWFDAKGEHHQKVFREAVLEQVPERAPNSDILGGNRSGGERGWMA